LPQVLKDIDKMPDSTISQIVDKYIEMNIAHPFMEGNGRATRIWLDLLLKYRLMKCIDWSKIDKDDYLSAMKVSPIDSKPIFDLLNGALTDDIDNRDIFMKGIDCSYYYEEEE
jgi:cell filamentation protein